MARKKDGKQSIMREKAKGKERVESSGKMSRKQFDKELRKLQVELCHLHGWVQ